MSDQASTDNRKLSLPTKTLIGLALGVACGLFFGELCGWLKVIGDAFVGLLQMTVLPYISISLVAGVGRLTANQAGRLLGRVGLFLLIFWAIGMLTVVLTASTFPPRPSAAFYSSTLLETPESLNYLDIFIPTNPFRSLANNWIPAVVLFCVGMGAAVMVMPNKTAFIARLDDWLDVIRRLNGYVVALTPYGVFAIIAASTGTMTFEEFARVQAYVVSYSVAVLLLAFLILPALITACTPFRYREILDVTAQAMLTAFATSKLIVVLPQLIEKTQQLFAKHGYESEGVRSDVDVIYPLVYPIPNLGKLLTLTFIPFAAWFVGTPLEAADYPSLLGLGSLTYFAGPIIATSFLLDAFRLPADLLQLFVVTGVYTSRIGDLLGVMHLFALSALGTCATREILSVRYPRLVMRLSVSVAVAVVLLLAVRGWLARSTSAGPSKEAVVAQMQLLRHPSHALVHKTVPSQVTPLGDRVSHLDTIRESGVIRVGYQKDRLPYSYFNADGELVGIDIDLAHRLATELNCRLEFIPFEYANLSEALDANHFDFAVSGLPMTTSNLLRMRFCKSYLEVSVAFVVPDHRRDEFATIGDIRSIEDLAIAVKQDEYLRDKVRARLPNAKVVHIDRIRNFFEGGDPRADALLIDAESGSAWTFLYPGFRPVVPRDLRVKIPLGFAVVRRDRELAEFLSQWIELKKNSGELQELYDYWILGRIESQREPRWSILRNVMGVGME